MSEDAGGKAKGKVVNLRGEEVSHVDPDKMAVEDMKAVEACMAEAKKSMEEALKDPNVTRAGVLVLSMVRVKDDPDHWSDFYVNHSGGFAACDLPTRNLMLDIAKQDVLLDMQVND